MRMLRNQTNKLWLSVHKRMGLIFKLFLIHMPFIIEKKNQTISNRQFCFSILRGSRRSHTFSLSFYPSFFISYPCNHMLWLGKFRESSHPSLYCTSSLSSIPFLTNRPKRAREVDRETFGQHSS